MSVTVRIPTPLRSLTDGQAELALDATDVRGVVDALEDSYPGLAARILDDDGELRRFVNVFVRDEDVRFRDGLDTAVSDGDIVSIVPAVAGGA